MKKFSLFMAALAALIFSCPAFSQSVPLQGGPWTAGHMPMYSLSGGSQPVIQDGGTASGGAAGTNPSELGITIRGTGTAPYANQGNGVLNTNICDYDAPTNNTGGYHYLCLSPNAQGGGLLTYGSGGGAPDLPFQMIINGTPYSFPGVGSGNVTGPLSSTVGHIAIFANGSGTLLQDGGKSLPSGEVVGTSDTQTLTNKTIDAPNISAPSITGTVVIGGVAMSFPSSGNIVGTSDVQTLTNKSIDASEVNSGTFSSTQIPDLDASKITSGVFSSARIPMPTTVSIGGVKSSTASSGQFANGIDTSGNVQYEAPPFQKNVTGSVSTTVNAKLQALTVTPQDFGAYGDGVHDDTTALNSLATWAAGQSNVTVNFPCGTYNISGTINWNTQNKIDLEGSGACTLISVTTANPNFVVFEMYNGTLGPSTSICADHPCGIVRGFTFTRPIGTPGSSNVAIQSLYDQSAIVANNKVTGYTQAYAFDQSYAPRIENNTCIGVTSCIIAYEGTGYASSFNGALITGNQIFGGGSASLACLSIGGQANGMTISGNDIEYCYTGVRSYGAADVIFTGNYIENSITDNLVFSSSSSSSPNAAEHNNGWIVKGNWFGQTGTVYNPTGNTHSNTTIDGLSSTTGIATGMTIQGAGIPANTTITGISGTTLTISNAATATASGVSFAIFQPTTTVINHVGGFDFQGNTIYNSSFQWGSDVNNLKISQDNIYSGSSVRFYLAAALASPQAPIMHVSQLPACGASTAGSIIGVDDANSPTLWQNVSGGGTFSIPVYCNGSGWLAF